MFSGKRIEHILKGNTIAGVEVIFLPDGSFFLNAVLLKKDRSSVNILKKAERLRGFEQLASLIDPKTPLVLILNGKGIIHRKTVVNENDTDLSLLLKTLPNASPEDFSIQRSLVNGQHAFISVVRNNLIAEILIESKKNKFNNIVAVVLGPFTINQIIPLLHSSVINNEYLSFGIYKLLIRENAVNDLELNSTETDAPVKIGDETLNPALVIPFASALTYFLDDLNGVKNGEADLIISEAKQKKKFQLTGWSMTILAFIVLMSNYFIFDHYWQKSNEMNARLLINQSALSRFDNLKKEFSQKEEFLKQNGLLESSRSSFYADRLAASLPFSIQWTNLHFNPLKKKEANDISEGVSFENKTIRINGLCQRSTELNDWIKEIKTKPWIRTVTLVDFKQDNNSEMGIFHIDIQLQ
ncbi:MAG TPA: hypothetical protein VF868_01425 [Bacteroidia bacterium]|jgi:Tfp pilus assembly protein PilN